MIISQKDLAEKLGISQMTVSRVMRGENGVSEKLRTRIMDLAREAGFQVPEFQQRTAGERAHVVCSMVNIGRQSDDADFQVRLLHGVMDGGREYRSEVVNFGEGFRGQWPLVVNRRQVDGVVHVFGGEPVQRPSRACPVTHVSIFSPIDDASDWVTVSNVDAAKAIGEYLARLGHRRAAFIGPTTGIAQERLLGLRAGLEVDGGGVAPDETRMDMHASRSSVAKQLDVLIPPGTTPRELKARFTAIAFYNDDMAFHGIEHLRSRGFRVPEDISVTGFDGATPSAFSAIHLTTAAIPLEDVGAEAVRLLYWRLDCPKAPVRRLALNAPLVEGETVARVER